MTAEVLRPQLPRRDKRPTGLNFSTSPAARRLRAGQSAYRGGLWRLNNLQTLCRRCNSRKGSR